MTNNFNKIMLIALFSLLSLGSFENRLEAKSPSYSNWGWSKGQITNYYPNIRIANSSGNQQYGCIDFNSIMDQLSQVSESIKASSKKFCENGKLYPKKELNRIYLIDNFDLQLSSLQNVMCYVYTYNIVCGYIKWIWLLI